MTTDELIAKSLEGTLTAGEHSRLQDMMAASPELAEEVRRLRTIEDMLVQPQEDRLREAAPFLHSVEDKIAASLVAAGGASSLTQLSNLTRAMFAPLLVVIGSVGIFFAVRPGTVTPAQQVAIQSVTPPSFEMQVPSTPRTDQPVTRAERQLASAHADRAAGTGSTEHSVVNVQTPSVSDPGSANAMVRNSPKPSPVIERASADFDNAMRTGDKLQAGMAAFRLGMLYKSADREKAVYYLKTAVDLSRESKLQEYEARSLGQLGLIARKEGNTAAADKYLRECISILEQLDNAKLLNEWRNNRDNH